MSSLLELSAEARELAELLQSVEEARQEADGAEACAALDEAETALEARLAAVAENIEAKADAYGDIIAEFTARAEVMRHEEDRYKRKRQVAENAARKLKSRLQFVLEDLGLAAVEGERWKLALQKSPASVTVTDEGLAVAQGFGEIVQQARVDARAVLAAWKQDPASVATFAEVVQGTHLRIR